MGFRFRKSIKILPGVRINLSKSGISVSLGVRGASLNISERGARVTAGLPGSGASYSKQISMKKLTGEKQSGRKQKRHLLPDKRALADEFAISEDEKDFVEGLKAWFVDEDENKALAHLKKATHFADGAFLAGCLSLEKKDLENAEAYLMMAQQNSDKLGQIFSKHDIQAQVGLQITDELMVEIAPDEHGVSLALVEVYQAQERFDEAINRLKHLQNIAPDDVLVRLSLAELLLETRTPPPYQDIIQITGAIQNDTPIHAALMLYKAEALRQLNMLDMAKEVLTTALRRKKDRSVELLNALRYERAMVYLALEKPAQARKDLERIYAANPDYEDVAERLNL